MQIWREVVLEMPWHVDHWTPLKKKEIFL
jgi:hypothetical protein